MATEAPTTADALTDDERSVLAVLARGHPTGVPARYRVEFVGPHAGYPTGPTMGKRPVWDARADAALASLCAQGLAVQTGDAPAMFASTHAGAALVASAGLRPGSPR